MLIEEQTLLFELNKLLRTKRDKASISVNENNNVNSSNEGLELQLEKENNNSSSPFSDTEHQERDIIRILLNYGEKTIHLPHNDST